MGERQIPVKVARQINSLVAAASNPNTSKHELGTHRAWVNRVVLKWVEDEVRRATEAAVTHNQQVGWTKAVARIHEVIEAGNTIGGVRATMTRMMLRPLDVQEPKP